MMMKMLLSLFFATASAETVEAAASMADMPLMTRGLIVTAGGLAGVFLVLFLFYFTIKLMQKLGK